jgi:hypothetical protein
LSVWRPARTFTTAFVKLWISAWWGEINARAGRRVAALGRWGSEVVARQPNRTLTWLADAPVERLTVVRHVPHPRATA